MEFKDDNIIRVSDKDIRTYLGQCDKKFNKYPEIILSFGESFAEKARTMVSILGAIGIKVDDSNINKLSNNLVFNKQEENILNRKTGRREEKVFYQIKLTKIPELDVENINNYEFIKLENSKMIKETEPIKNELKISDNSLDFYLGQCNLDFQSYDQLVLSTLAENIETIKYIIKILNLLGIQVDDKYIDFKNKKIYFYAIERERINPKSGRKERKVFYRLGITKIPDLYMYTDPKSAIEYPREE